MRMEPKLFTLLLTTLLLKYRRYILFLFLLPFAVNAQTDTLSFRERYYPTGLRLGTDAIAIVRTMTDPRFKGWEVNADVDFHRYFLVVDYGTWALNHPGDSLDYSNDGNYWRIGGDVNFLVKDEERNMVFLGFRYAHSTFNETFRVLDKDPNWGDLNRYDNPFVNNKVPARWFELTTGIKVRMFSWFWMGYTARFKFGLKTGETLEMEPFDIPGYGNTHKKSTWGFNYQLMFRIPLRPLPPLPPAKKKKKSTTPAPSEPQTTPRLQG
jgi:hypothetical protein